MHRLRLMFVLWGAILWLLVGCQGTEEPTSPSPTAARTEVVGLASPATRDAGESEEQAAASTATETRASETATPTPTRTATATETASATAVPPTATVPPAPTEAATVVPPPPPPPAAPVAANSEQPVRLQIPRLGVDAAIESVGQTSDGRMDVPQGVQNVAWYNLGARPGEAGNTVLSGHLDDYKQDPAVFWRLNELEPGDQISVTDAQGVTHTFEVTGKELYAYDQAPLNRIFGFSLTSNLNLITCNGTWDSNALNYDQRLVVYSRLVR